jgi:uncharacterized paraquat-inducible protein A
MSTLDWILVALLLAVHLATAMRVAMAAGRLGRSPIRWLAITICLSAIPAMIVFYLDVKRRQRERLAERKTSPPPRGIARCPNCRAIIDPAESAGLPLKTCPRCHLPIEKVNLA